MGLLDYLETSGKQLARIPADVLGLLDDWMEWRGQNADRLAEAGKSGIEATKKALKGEKLTDAEQAALVETPASSVGTADIQAPGLLFAGTYGGVKSATANIERLSQAKALEKAGGDASPGGDIRKVTGWHKDKAGDWKYEISDKGMRLKDPKEFLTPEQADTLLNNPDRDPVGVRLGDMVEHPALFGAYPEMQDYGVSLFPNLDPHSGWFTPNDKLLSMGVNTGKYTPETPGFSFSPQHRLTTLHEMQHGVQNIEGHAQGGSPTMLVRKKVAIEDEIYRLRGERQSLHWEGKGPDTPEVAALTNRIMALEDEYRKFPVDDYLGYQRLLGEVEARDVEARADLDHQERQSSTPYASQGVQSRDMLIRKTGAPEGAADISMSQPQPPPLDLSPEARAARAAAQGYNLDAYHGTKADFPQFQTQATPERPNPDAFIHVGDQDAANGILVPEWHQEYLQKQIDYPPFPGADEIARSDLESKFKEARVLPLKIKANNPLDMPDLGRWDNHANFMNAAAKEKGWGQDYEPKGWNPPPEVWTDFRALVDRVRKLDWDQQKPAWQEGFADILKRHGYDSVRYPNEIEGKGGFSYMLLDPHQARSRFAKFDPAKAGDPDLLAAYSPNPLGGLLAGQTPSEDEAPALLPYGLTETVKRRARRGLLER